ncbi:MAG: hypothetical protein EOM24_33410, partial [Chloroflexia bacterium]|nr:hypothetical protein [Chloroflexia bacterium]
MQRTQLETAIQVAEQRLVRATGGANVCQLQRDGRVTGGVKYDEGWLVALVTLRRSLRTEAEDAQVVAEQLATWQAALAEQQQRTPPSLPWLAYRQGGVDALAQLSTGCAPPSGSIRGVARNALPVDGDDPRAYGAHSSSSVCVSTAAAAASPCFAARTRFNANR